MCGCCDAIQNGTVYEIFYEMFPAHDQAANVSFLLYTKPTLYISLHVSVNVNKSVYSSHFLCTFPIVYGSTHTAFSVCHSAGQSATKNYSLVIFFRLISHE